MAVAPFELRKRRTRDVHGPNLCVTPVTLTYGATGGYSPSGVNKAAASLGSSRGDMGVQVLASSLAKAPEFTFLTIHMQLLALPEFLMTAPK